MRYLVRRLAHALLLLFGVSVLAFLMAQMAPGNFVSEMRLDPQISPEVVSSLRAQYGLDQPLYVRYGRWLESAARGEFGYSFSYNMPVAKLIWPRARNTFILTATATLLAWIIALPIGVWTAASQNRLAARATSAGVSILFSVPDVMLALGALVFAASTRLLPAGGMFSPDKNGATFLGTASDLARHLVLPAMVLAAGIFPVLVRHIRAAVAEVLDASFMKSARGFGIPRRQLLFRYALRAAANPLISLAGFSIAGLLSGSLLVEVIWSWPGLGPLLIESILARDVYVVVGAVLLSAVFLVGGNFLADVALFAADPRIRLERGESVR
jgi:peptide/nickel transport system permease protein